jgi:cytosine/uracil/thiamine/allantoin permease
MEQGEHFERKKALAVFLSLIMLGAIAVSVFKALELFALLNDFDSQPFYFRLPLVAFPLLITSPMLMMLIYIVLRRHFGNLPEQHFALWVKVSLVLLTVAFVLRIVLGFWLPGYVAANGFTHCSKLENPSPFASQVWVRQPQYCHELSYLVNVELLEWFDEQQAAGAKPSNNEVIAQIELFIAEHKQRYR